MRAVFTLTFSVGSLRRLAAGTKRATVIRPGQARKITLGESIIATARDVDAQVPLRVVSIEPVPNLDMLPAVARRAGLDLADITTLPTWNSYRQTLRRTMPAAATALLVLEPHGPVVGAPPATWTRPRLNPDSVQGHPWHRVTPELEIHPADQVHDADQAELKTRVATAIRDGHPDYATVRTLAAVTAALLRSGRCGPASLGKPHQRRLADELGPALDWLTTHGVLGEHGPEQTWSRDLLAGLRINQDDRPPPA